MRFSDGRYVCLCVLVVVTFSHFLIPLHFANFNQIWHILKAYLKGQDSSVSKWRTVLILLHEFVQDLFY